MFDHSRSTYVAFCRLLVDSIPIPDTFKTGSTRTIMPGLEIVHSFCFNEAHEAPRCGLEWPKNFIGKRVEPVGVRHST